MVYLPLSSYNVLENRIVLTSGYGMRYLDGKWSFHDGIDLAPTKNINDAIPIIASVNGEIKSFRPPNSGKYQQITPLSGPYKGYKFRTVHQNVFKIENGKVKAGDIIGYMGNSGTQAKHVHFEIYMPDNKTPVNPYSITQSYYNNSYQPEMINIQFRGEKDYIPVLVRRGTGVHVSADRKSKTVGTVGENSEEEYILYHAIAITEGTPIGGNTMWLYVHHKKGISGWVSGEYSKFKD